MDEYVTEFVRESEESITELNNALLDLEKDPDDERAMDRIFRTAHTLKGNCGAMGFEDASDLAHALEDMLDAMRAGSVEVTGDTMDLVFDAVDEFEAMVEEVSDHGEPRSDPEPTIERVRETVDAADVEFDGPEPFGPPDDRDLEAALADIARPVEPSNPLYHVRLAVSEGESVLGVDGMLVLEALADAFDVLGTVPDPEMIQDGEYERSFDAVISSAIEAEDITAALDAVGQVDDVVVTDVTEDVDLDDGEPEMAEAPDELGVNELLDEFEEFDDLDDVDPRQVDGIELDDLGDAGSFQDVEIAETAEGDVDEVLDDEDEMLDPEAPIDDAPQDTQSTFEELQEEVDQVGFEELQEDLEELEFEELQGEEEEVSFEELLDEGGDGPGDDDLDTFGSEFDEADDGLAEFEGLAGVGDQTEDVAEFESEFDDEIEFGETEAFDSEFDGEDEDDLNDLVDADDGIVGTDAAAEFESFADDIGGEIAEPAPDDADTDERTDAPDDDAAASNDATVDAESPGGEAGDVDAESAFEELLTPDDGDGESDGADEIQSVRVDVDELDRLYSHVEELVTNRIRLRRAIDRGEAGLERAVEEVDELEKVTARMQDTVMDIRLVPLEQVTARLPRVVRDVARERDKEVTFEMEGQDVELDRTILDEMGDPLMHLVRNAVDHGIEAPEERESAGKPREGTVELRASRVRDRVEIVVEDDGRGLDAQTLRESAVQQSIVSPDRAAEMDDEEAYELVFHPGFSTSEEVTAVSGRGVGMDVVHDAVTGMDGTVQIESEPGEGTTVSLRLPISLATVRVLFVETGGEEYGIPIKSVDEVTRVSNIRNVEGEEVYAYDETAYPLVRLGEALDTPGRTKNGSGRLIRVNDEVRQVALHCDSVTRQEEVVVKPFEGVLSDIPGLSGATVLGEGNVVTILDVESL